MREKYFVGPFEAVIESIADWRRRELVVVYEEDIQTYTPEGKEAPETVVLEPGAWIFVRIQYTFIKDS